MYNSCYCPGWLSDTLPPLQLHAAGGKAGGASHRLHLQLCLQTTQMPHLSTLLGWMSAAVMRCLLLLELPEQSGTHCMQKLRLYWDGGMSHLRREPCAASLNCFLVLPQSGMAKEAPSLVHLHLCCRPPTLPADSDTTSAEWVSTPAQLQEMVRRLGAASALGVDVEHHAKHSYLGFICLIQLSTGDSHTCRHGRWCAAVTELTPLSGVGGVCMSCEPCLKCASSLSTAVRSKLPLQVLKTLC